MRKILCILCALAILLLGCSPESEPEGGEEKLTGDFTLAMGTPDSLDPLKATQESCILVFDLIYDSLVYVDREMRPVPYLAESCALSEDGMTISFTLHDGVLWHDGAALTSRDVEYTINRIRSMGQACIYYHRLDYIREVEVVDILHFNLHLTKPHVTVLNLLDFPIVPCHRTDLDTNMVGTGQYKLSAYTPRKNMTLEKNPVHTLSETPAMETIQIKILERSQDAANMVKIGEVTAVASKAQTVGGLGIGKNMEITRYPTLEYEFIGFNTENAHLSSSRVRQAISYAQDRARMIEDVFLGYGSAACVPVPPTAYMYIGKEGDIAARDTEKAKSLLFEAGYNLTDGVMRRVREDETEETLSLSLLINEENERRKKSAQIIKESLSEVGISVSVETTSFEDYLYRLEEGAFDMYLGSCLFSADLSYDFLLGEERTVKSGYASLQMQEAIDHIAPQRSDDTIRAAFIQFQEVFLRDMPLSGIGFLDGALVHTASLRGIENPAASKLYRNIGKWYLK